MDVLVYDQTRDFSFSDGDIHILPAEALLVSIEIKSKLNAGEIIKCCESARRLRGLRPYRREQAERDVGLAKTKEIPARYFHCVFAYDTDLVDGSNWLKTEADRFASKAAGDYLIDSIYVLGRGLINLNGGRGRIEDLNGSAITSFISAF